MVKEDIRKIVIDARRSANVRELCKLSSLLIENILNIEEILNSKCFMFYYPMKGEPDILPLAERCIKKGLCVTFPVVCKNTLKAVVVKNLKSFRKNKFGVYEPVSGKEVEPYSLEVIFVPGLAFDRELYRIGFGKGFYDRFLRNTKGLKVGVAFDFQIFDTLPRDNWDVPLDILVTPYDILKRR